MERNGDDEFLEFADLQLDTPRAQRSLKALEQQEAEQALYDQQTESSSLLNKFRGYSSRKKSIIIGMAGIGIAYVFGIGYQAFHGTMSTNRTICQDWEARDDLVGKPVEDVATSIVGEQGLPANEAQDIFNMLIAKNIGAFEPQEAASGPLVVTKKGFDVPTDCR